MLTNCRKSFVAKLFYRSRHTNLRHLCLIGAKVFWWVSVSWKSAERSNLRNDVARVAETLRVNVSAHWTKIIEFLQKKIDNIFGQGNEVISFLPLPNFFHLLYWIKSHILLRNNIHLQGVLSWAGVSHLLSCHLLSKNLTMNVTDFCFLKKQGFSNHFKCINSQLQCNNQKWNLSLQYNYKWKQGWANFGP